MNVYIVPEANQKVSLFMSIRKLTLLILLLINLSATAQNYSGTWVGLFNTYTTASIRRSFHFYMHLQQAGRAVWGVYTTGESSELKKADCTCRVSGQVSKSNKASITLNKDGIISTTISDELCDNVNYFEVKFVEKDNHTYLAGNWFGNSTNVTLAGGASGNFSIVKVSDTVDIDVNSYFPKLNKLIEKANPGDPAYSSSQKQSPGKSSIQPGTGTVELQKPFDKRENILFETIAIDTSVVDVDLYDNGVIDGDSVSVYLNKQLIIKNYKLNDVAKKLQLKMDPTIDNELLIVAENLGTIPPNTGLMVITAKGVRHEIRVSSSFEANAKVILRR